MTQRSFSQKFWEDKHGNFVVWQRPNIWLLTWFITMVMGWFVPAGTPLKITGWISLTALIIWALLETVKGVNYFRRTLGVLVLLLLLMVHFLIRI